MLTRSAGTSFSVCFFLRKARAGLLLAETRCSLNRRCCEPRGPMRMGKKKVEMCQLMYVQGRGYIEIIRRERERENQRSQHQLDHQFSQSQGHVISKAILPSPAHRAWPYHSSTQGSGPPHCAGRSRAEMPGGTQSDPGCLARAQDKWTGRSQMSPLQ